MTFEMLMPPVGRSTTLQVVGRSRRLLAGAALLMVGLLATACGGAVLDTPWEDAGVSAGAGAAGRSPAGAAGAGGAAGRPAGNGGASAGHGGSTGPVVCPVSQPPNGSICVSEGQTCDYVSTSCAACRCQYHCWNGSWVQDGSGCTPPTPPPAGETCPLDRPRDGTYCVASPSGGCTYVAATCMEKPSGFTTYFCVANLWKVGNSTLEPCNIPPPTRDAGVDVVRFDAAASGD